MRTGNSADRLRQSLTTLVESAASGSALPSVRELMHRHRVSPVTVHRVLGELARSGRIVTRPGIGSFVAAPSEPARPGSYGWQSAVLGAERVPAPTMGEDAPASARGTLALSNGYLDASLQPQVLLTSAISRAGRRPGVWNRAPVEGLDPLRSWFATEVGVRTSDVLIVPGGQAGLSLALRALAAPGAPVLFEVPSYKGALATARAAGLRPVPVACDGDGPLPAELERTLASSGATLMYAQPTYANPTGRSWSLARRAQILEVLGRARAFLIEDDSSRALALEGTAPPSLASRDLDGHVVHLASLTKLLAPGLRIGAVCARGAAAARLRAMLEVDELFAAGVLQEATLEIVTSNGWRRHLATVRRVLRERRDAILGALEGLPLASPIAVPQGGLHLWLALAEGIDDLDVASRAQAVGVTVGPGAPWFGSEPPGAYLRLSYGAAPTSALLDGAERLKKILTAARPAKRKR